IWLTEQTNVTFSPRLKGWWLGYVQKESNLSLTNGSFAVSSFLSRKSVFTLADKRKQGCLSLMNGTLNSVECSQELGYICKRKKNLPLKCDMDEGWTHIQDSCFRFFTTSATWNNAKEKCESDDANLARIQTKEQMLYVWKLARMSSTASWNGFSFNDESNLFQWTDGSYLGQWWNKNVSDNRGNNSGSCGVIDGTLDLTSAWTTGSCFDQYSFTCVKPSGHCPDGWNTAEDTCFKMFPKPKLLWSHAKKHCTELGAELLKITSQKIQDEISLTVYPLINLMSSFWIGISDETGSFTWSDGSSVNFSNWNRFSFAGPDDFKGKRQGFIHVDDEKGQWWVDGNLTKRSFGCSMSKNKSIASSHINTTDHSLDSGKKNHFLWRYDPDCGMTWEKRPGTDLCYLFREAKATWFEALDSCLYKNGSLASITSSEEQSYIEGKLRHSSILKFWIGASDRRDTMNIQWEDRTPFTFFNWDDGKPELSNFPNCIGISTESMSWSDFSCYMGNGYICKRKAFSPKAPSPPAFIPRPLARGLYYGCDPGWLKYGNHCYQINTQNASYLKAASECKSRNSTLVTIHSKEENGFLWSQLPLDAQPWIGVMVYSNGFLWVEDTPFNFVNWESWTNRIIRFLASAYMDQKTGKWNPSESSFFAQGFSFICKKPDKIVSSPPVKPYSAGCMEEGYAYAEFCYTFYSSNTSWDQAQRFCQLRKGNLATVSSSVANDFISSVFGAQGGSFWMGLSVLKGRSQWVNGTTSQKSFWNSKYHGNSDGCAAMEPNAQLWQLENCSSLLPFVCETVREGFTTPSVITTTSAPTTVMATCPPTWLRNNGICYKTFSFRKSWHEARFHCESLGGNLPIIHDADTNTYISNLVKSNNFPPVWIGLHDTSVEKAFEWIDGSPYDFSKWGNTEPNSLTISEDCGEIERAGYWNDINCHITRPYICSMRPGAPTVPAPASTTPAPKCLGGDWSYHKEYCYFFSNNYKSWRMARKECLSKGGDLASVLSEEENNFLLNQIYMKMITGDMWIGYSKKDRDSFVWSDGKPSGFESFIGSKDDSDYLQCVNFRAEHAGWYKNRCTTELKYICKRLNDSTDPIVLSTTPLIDGACPSGFVGSDFINKCYMVVNNHLTWSDARDACANMSSVYKVQMASINNAQEQDLVKPLISKMYFDVWIGLRRYNEENFSWLDESDVEFTNWEAGYPFNPYFSEYTLFKHALNHRYLTRPSCVALASARTSASWRLHQCDSKNSFLCQTLRVPGLTTSSPTVSSCPVGFNQLKSTCILLMSERKPWEEASKSCERRGAHLTTAMDSQGLLMLTSLVWRHHLGPVIWLGLKFNEMLSKYEWTNGLPVLKTFWSRTSKKYAANSSCIILRNSQWTTSPCNKTLPFICEIRNDLPARTTPVAANYCADRKLAKFGKFCYLIKDKEKLSWPEANHKCQRMNMQLVSIHSSGQVEFLLDELKRLKGNWSYIKNGVNLWTGLIGYEAGTFGWSDGSALEYLHWADGKPSKKTEERCVEMSHTNGQWNDLDCFTHKLGYICQTPAESNSTTITSPTPNSSVSILSFKSDDSASSISITRTDTALIVIGCLVLAGGISAAIAIYIRKKRRHAPTPMEPITNQEGFCSVLYTALREEN
ncbi:hypothetical protein Btru_047253, partial [Bulinus truncatus]